MQTQALVRPTRGHQFHLLIWVTGVALIGALFYVVKPPQRAHTQKSVPMPVIQAAKGVEPILPQVITSKATDKFEYLADVLRQLSAHPHASCRDEVAGSQCLMDELSRAKDLKARGNLQDAELVLKSVENRLERKYKLECLKLG